MARSAGESDAVGIVAIGRNEGERLSRCLASLPEAYPVVYVDSGSSDGSRENARRRGALVVELDLSTPFTAARARNAGFDALLGAAPETEFVQFIDGDCILSPAWLCEATKFLREHEDAAVVCGRRREVDPDASIYNRMCDAEWNTPIGEAEACGGDSLMRVSAFTSVSGFRTQLIAGEEPELCARLRSAGWSVWRIDAAMTGHDAAITRLKQWWMRTMRGGFGYAQVWTTTRGERFTLYGRNVMRAVFWAGVLPAVLLIAALFRPLAAVLLVVIYAAQIARVALRSSLPPRLAWSAAFFNMLAKFAELQGVIRFFWRARRDRARSAIEYK